MSDSTFDGFEQPNTTPVPNIIFDEIMAELPLAEFRVIMYIVRRTFGFQKQADGISLSQFEHGIVTRDGERLDRGVNLNRRTIERALISLKKKKFIIKKRRKTRSGDSDSTLYALNMRGLMKGLEKPSRKEGRGAQTPTGRGAQTPTGRGAQTPTGRGAQTPHKKKNTKKRIQKRESSKAASPPSRLSSSSKIEDNPSQMKRGETASEANLTLEEERAPDPDKASLTRTRKKEAINRWYSIFGNFYQSKEGYDQAFQVPHTYKNDQAIRSIIQAGYTEEQVRFVFDDIWNDPDSFWKQNRTITSVVSQFPARIGKMHNNSSVNGNNASQEDEQILRLLQKLEAKQRREREAAAAAKGVAL